MTYLIMRRGYPIFNEDNGKVAGWETERAAQAFIDQKRPDAKPEDYSIVEVEMQRVKAGK